MYLCNHETTIYINKNSPIIELLATAITCNSVSWFGRSIFYGAWGGGFCHWTIAYPSFPCLNHSVHRPWCVSQSHDPPTLLAFTNAYKLSLSIIHLQKTWNIFLLYFLDLTGGRYATTEINLQGWFLNASKIKKWKWGKRKEKKYIKPFSNGL